MKNIVILPAAGVGSRFGAAIPKQYAQIAGQTVLQHTLNIFAQHAKIHHIAVIISPADDYFAQYIRLPENAAVYAIGGNTRAQTVQNGVNHLLQHAIAAPEDLIFVHDAARCCLPLSALERLIQAAQHPAGALLAIPVADTLKQQTREKTVAQTIDRSALWQAQTPQVFQAALLQRALANANPEQITDEASAIETLGLQPLLVEGASRNFKLTRPDDALLAEFLLGLK
ncbi:2-C-methyl-D-erythritol 4-phosphate cytidylyltransferase [Neisseriaceae bacterium B1]